MASDFASPSENNSDLLFERAPARLVQEQSIATDKSWSPALAYRAKARGFLYAPFQAAYDDGAQLSPADYLTVIATATLASIGTAGVPSVGLVTLAMVFDSVGLPVAGIGLIMGIDRILDMLRTAVNITGDAVCTTIVAKQQGSFNENTFQADN